MDYEDDKRNRTVILHTMNIFLVVKLSCDK